MRRCIAAMPLMLSSWLSMRAPILRSESEVMESAPKEAEIGAQKRSKARAGSVMMAASSGSTVFFGRLLSVCLLA